MFLRGHFCLFQIKPLSSKMYGCFTTRRLEPMENHEIQDVLMNALSLQEVRVSGDGSHFQVIAVGEIFADMSRVKKQQVIYAPLMEYLADNRIHALSIKTYTPVEWERDRKLNGF